MRRGVYRGGPHPEDFTAEREDKKRYLLLSRRKVREHRQK